MGSEETMSTETKPPETRKSAKMATKISSPSNFIILFLLQHLKKKESDVVSTRKTSAIVGKKGIEPHWYEPFNNTVDSYLIGVGEMKIDDVLNRFAAQAEKVFA